MSGGLKRVLARWLFRAASRAVPDSFDFVAPWKLLLAPSFIPLPLAPPELLFL